jgi:carboxyl-terminal processing protease
LLLVAATACSAVGLGNQGGGNRIVTPPPAPRATTVTATPGVDETPATASAGPARLRGEGLSASDLYTAYRAIVDTFVDPIDGEQLIRAGTDSLRASLDGQVNLPLLTLPVQLLPNTTGNVDRDWQAFGDAYDSVVTKMPQWAQDAHPDWAILRGMIDSLKDGHTSFLTPDEARRRGETSFAGIGVLLSRPQNDQPPLIAEIFTNSPASTSGLKRGDRILSVDGNDVSGKAVQDIASLIRGPLNTEVKLTIRRLSSTGPLDFTLRRAQVQVEQVIGRQVPSLPIGYLRIRSFTDEAVAQQALGILNQGRQRGLRGWVLDVRGNPGGSLRAVLGVSAGFVDPSHVVIGYQVDRQRRQTPLETQAINITEGMGVVVLVDHDTASGAEILAAALQEAKLAQLVGSKTAGNVGVATQITLPDESVLQVTEQRFVSPGGTQIDGVGVTPDVPIELTDEDLENDRDPQLMRALELVLQKVQASGG